jgi:excisionase family DNA binding protein
VDTVYQSTSSGGAQQQFYTLKQAAFILNLCERTVRRLIERGHLSKCPLIRKILIPRKQVDTFADKHSEDEWKL